LIALLVFRVTRRFFPVALCRGLFGVERCVVVVTYYAWWQCCVFRCWIGHEHILLVSQLGSTLAPGPWGSLSAHCNL
jgi:hypothetical protein